MKHDLIHRIRERLKDDARRTGNGDYLRMPEEFRTRNRPDDAFADLWIEIQNRAVADLKPLKPIEPLTEKAVAKVEALLGFRLPDELRQLYLEIGDGGFGPYDGIRRLANWAKDYVDLRARLPGERGREWPERLLPIVYLNGKRICVDAKGAVVLWCKGPKKMSEKKWLASFVPQSPSLSEWLERWVDTPTQVEGGPEGGWVPPGEEVVRREAVECEKVERHERQLERARTIVHGDLQPLADDLLGQIRIRALDPKRRTYLASAAAGSTPIDLATIDDQLTASADVLPPQAMSGLSGLLGAVTRLSALTGGAPGLNLVQLGSGMAMIKQGAGGKLGAPATDHALAHAEEQLGFALPEPLRQLYRIADGGFGPGDTGLFSLATLLERYRKLTSTPEGPGDEPWPAKLLPLYECDPALGCLDLETGRIIVYDVQEMDFVSSQQWRKAFSIRHESIAELMVRWLGERTFKEEQRRHAV